MIRQILRQALRFLTQATLFKHQPTVIVVFGPGPTAIARELLTAVVATQYPVRRNSESPEAEFSVPLTVFDFKYYPQHWWNWVWVCVKTTMQLVYLPRFRHVLVLELNVVNSEIATYWQRALHPQFTVYVPSTPAKQAERMADKDIKRIAKKLGIPDVVAEAAMETVQFPAPRLAIHSTRQDITIIDATHYYYPSPLTAALELCDPATEAVTLITEVEGDVNQLAQLGLKDQIIVNPESLHLHPGDVVVLRGMRQRLIPRYRYLWAK